MLQWCCSGRKHHQNSNSRELFCSQNGCLFTFIIHKQSTSNEYLSICLVIGNIYGNGLAMYGSLVMCTVYTNKVTYGQLKLEQDYSSQQIISNISHNWWVIHCFNKVIFIIIQQHYFIIC